ncbi:hypothetical protein I3842_10G014200 [Carya illinoinensis]|uniref:Uncharacterized protein n=1 Tax=Carya illinoinensis TaxID=32201 RepID=A0A922DT84_CARIL|nr:hypothetical protein I3842_10G014200 [Carya illinoinensis]
MLHFYYLFAMSSPKILLKLKATDFSIGLNPTLLEVLAAIGSKDLG